MWIKKVMYISLLLFASFIAIEYGKQLEHTNELNKQLKIALDQEQHEEIMFKINAGADVNTINAHGLTALMIAAKNGEINLLQWLINRKLKHHNVPNLDKETPWDQPHVGEPALSFALKAKNLEAVKLLVEAGAIVNKYNPSGTVEKLDTIPESLRQRNVPLLTYAIGAKLPMPFILLLLSGKNIDVNQKTFLQTATPLMIAAAIGYEDAVKALLDAGADKEIINTLDNIKAIDYARDAGYENIVK